VVIPNGLYVDRFAHAEPREEWRGTQGTVAFVGRFDEPRKGFALLAEAFVRVAADRPGLQLLVVGGGDVEEARALFPEVVRDRVRFLGRASDQDKAAALRTADVYVAPNTGGESFGIILVEAMAAGATVLASDIPAFRRVVEDTAGVLFAAGDVEALADGLAALLDDPARTAVRRYDWSSVAGRILRVYETVVAGAA
jgi:phosphatidylinositol alpha-mannosyltransferase